MWSEILFLLQNRSQQNNDKTTVSVLWPLACVYLSRVVFSVVNVGLIVLIFHLLESSCKLLRPCSRGCCGSPERGFGRGVLLCPCHKLGRNWPRHPGVYVPFSPVFPGTDFPIDYCPNCRYSERSRCIMFIVD